MRSDRAKVLHEVGGRPLLAWAIDSARAAGAERIVAVLGHQIERVRADLTARYGQGNIAIAHQREPNGTGHAVMTALGELASEADDRVVVVTSGDVPLLPADVLAALVRACEGASSGLSLVSSTMPRQLPYGRIVRDAEGEVVRIVEHADATAEERAITEFNAGFYAMALGRLRGDIASLTSDNAQGELYLTDLIEKAARRGRVGVVEAPYEEVAGVNDRVDLAAVEATYQRRRREALMRAGVTLVSPEQTFVDADVGPVGGDVWIAPGVQLRGVTRIGDGARIDAHCVVVDADIGAGASLGPGCVIQGAAVAPGEVVEALSHRG